jgi:hypothetical protein
MELEDDYLNVEVFNDFVIIKLYALFKSFIVYDFNSFKLDFNFFIQSKHQSNFVLIILF